jgi:hypothetical protein
MTGGFRFAWEASGYAEIEGGGFSEVSVSEEEASWSISVPEEASMIAMGAARVDVGFVLAWGVMNDSFSFIGVGGLLFRFGGGGNAEGARVPGCVFGSVFGRGGRG